MKNAAVVALAVSFLAAIPASAQPAPAKPASVTGSLNSLWSQVEKDFISLADAMPEDKWNFKATDSVRTFGEQVKHVACANEAWGKKFRGEKKLPERCDLGGPNPAKTKAEIMAYLKQSFQSVDEGLAATNASNLLQHLSGPYAGTNRLEVANAVLWHTTDHYGQLVVYMRLNGIVPPASR